MTKSREFWLAHSLWVLATLRTKKKWRANQLKEQSQLERERAHAKRIRKKKTRIHLLKFWQNHLAGMNDLPEKNVSSTRVVRITSHLFEKNRLK